ncbi:MAG TPA: Calx-beta domain-containing protein [Candidatus Limnocylindria bacterium]|nr:Calx-beta domain-containing protein [Candidatus Limnocylindria bacterium]
MAEPVETVTLTLSHPDGGGFLGARTTAVLRILDNSPTIGFTGRWVGNGLEVERTGGTNVTSRVDYASVDGTAVAGSDYVGLSGTLTFRPGVRIRIIPITEATRTSRCSSAFRSVRGSVRRSGRS